MNSEDDIQVEAAYYPARRQYRLIAVSAGRLPRRRWYDSHEEMCAAVIKLNSLEKRGT